MKLLLIKAALAALVASMSLTASAAVVQTYGSGSAVTAATNVANFETNLTASNTWSEGGMNFSSPFDTPNNPCGYAGCSGYPGFAGFSGNFQYSMGQGAYISIQSASGSFSAIEFAAG